MTVWIEDVKTDHLDTATQRRDWLTRNGYEARIRHYEDDPTQDETWVVQIKADPDSEATDAAISLMY